MAHASRTPVASWNPAKAARLNSTFCQKKYVDIPTKNINKLTAYLSQYAYKHATLTGAISCRNIKTDREPQKLNINYYHGNY